MNLSKFHLFGGFALWLTGAGLVSTTAAQAQAEDQGYEVMTRGPVHEAFAATVVFDPQPGIVIDVEPPEPIEEQPPEQRPVGANVSWIPGYWGWEDEAKNFLWISGVWRNIPPGRQWVPGYWSAIENSRYQWTSGYWSGSEVEEITYLPEPPATLEVGANVAAPSDNYSWIPGSWSWQQTRYAWRPGYWTEVRPDWTWCPSYYSWTPRGYVYVDGYWDYPVPNRGVMFAPIHFHEPVYANAGFHYRPSVVIDINIFSSHFFVRPNYCHYYFGDYYASSYRDAGYFAPHTFHYNRRGYDPIFAYQRWQHRGDRDWDRRWSEQYDYRRDNRDARPPRRWSDMKDWERRGDRRGGDRYASRLEDYVSNRDKSGRFEPVGRETRERLMEQRQEMGRFRKERRDVERTVKARSGDERREVTTSRLRRSPVAARIRGEASPGRAAQDEAVAGGRNMDLAERNRRPSELRATENRRNPRPERNEIPTIKPDRRKAANEVEAKDARRPERPLAERKESTDRQRQQIPQPQRDITRREPPAPNITRPGPSTRGNSRPDPQVERRVTPQPTPQVPRREVPRTRPQPSPQIQRREVPQVRPQPAPRVQQRREVPQVRPQPAPQIQRREVPQVRQQPAPRVQRREAPQARPQPQRREIPQARSRPAPQIQRREAPQARPQPQRRESPRPQAARNPSPQGEERGGRRSR